MVFPGAGVLEEVRLGWTRRIGLGPASQERYLLDSQAQGGNTRGKQTQSGRKFTEV